MRIIKRKKGKQYYYYIQHSFRKNQKVVTKEKYLGKKIPHSIEKIEEELHQEQKANIYSILKKIKNRFQYEWNTYPASVKEKMLSQYAVDFTYNTNAIEGSTITLPETRELVEDHIAPHKKLSDVIETEQHARVFVLMLQKKFSLDNKLLLQWHHELFSVTKTDIAGFYRTFLIRVGSYLAPDWQDVPKLMNEMFQYYQKNKRIEHMTPVELAARMHYKFEKIHPFGDGNGRVGRLLMNHILWHHGYPLLIIEYKKRKSYYYALRKDENGFVRYFIRRYLNAHKKNNEERTFKKEK